MDKNIITKRPILGNIFILNEPSSQLGTPRSPPLQLGRFFDRPKLRRVVVVVVQISGPSSFLILVCPDLGLMRMGVHMWRWPWRMQKWATGVARSRRDARYLSSCRGINEPSREKKRERERDNSDLEKETGK